MVTPSLEEIPNNMLDFHFFFLRIKIDFWEFKVILIQCCHGTSPLGLLWFSFIYIYILFITFYHYGFIRHMIYKRWVFQLLEYEGIRLKILIRSVHYNLISHHIDVYIKDTNVSLIRWILKLLSRVNISWYRYCL